MAEKQDELIGFLCRMVPTDGAPLGDSFKDIWPEVNRGALKKMPEVPRLRKNAKNWLYQFQKHRLAEIEKHAPAGCDNG